MDIYNLNIFLHFHFPRTSTLFSFILIFPDSLTIFKKIFFPIIQKISFIVIYFFHSGTIPSLPHLSWHQECLEAIVLIFRTIDGLREIPSS